MMWKSLKIIEKPSEENRTTMGIVGTFHGGTIGKSSGKHRGTIGKSTGNDQAVLAHVSLAQGMLAQVVSQVF